MSAMPITDWYQMEIRGHSVFMCDKCKTLAQGDRFVFSPGLTSMSPQEIATRLSSIRPSAHYMPVGWSSYYEPDQTRHLCPNCRGEQA